MVRENGQAKRLALIPVRDGQQIEAVARLAEAIWVEYYTDILGDEQVEYMLANLQSPHKIQEDINSGKTEYYLMEAGDEIVGYLAIEWQKETLFLSKLYLLQSARRKGYASQALLHLMGWAKEHGKQELELTVNKYNEASIHFYERMGFERVASIVSPIGGGYVMDDYIYVHRLTDSQQTTQS